MLFQKMIQPKQLLNTYKTKCVMLQKKKTDDKVECPLCKSMVTRHYLLKYQACALCQREKELRKLDENIKKYTYI